MVPVPAAHADHGGRSRPEQRAALPQGAPDPVGEQRRALPGAENLESKLGTRILPKTFQVWDDPTGEKVGDILLLGHYRYDDEGVQAVRVTLVKDGKLESLCTSRAPTKKLSSSNGHARRAGGGGTPEAAIGCLFIKDDAGVPAAEAVALGAGLIPLAPEPRHGGGQRN